MIAGWGGPLKSPGDLLEAILQLFAIAAAVHAASYSTEIVGGAIAFSCLIGLIIRSAIRRGKQSEKRE
jgi:hypothetical protein